MGVRGQIYLVPSSVRTSDIARIVREGYDVNLLNDGFNALLDDLQLDVLLINKLPTVFDGGQVKQMVESLYGADVAAIIPHSDEMMALASGGVFTLRYPDHPVTEQYRQLVAKLLA